MQRSLPLLMFDHDKSNTLTQRTHSLRYVLKNRATNVPLLVIIFKLLPKEQSKGGDSGEENKEATTNDNDDLD